jgi:hypothetical protein
MFESFSRQVVLDASQDRSKDAMAMTENPGKTGAPRTEVGETESTPQAPQQREGDELVSAPEPTTCVYCGKASDRLEPDPAAPERFRCARATPYWNTACSRFLPHCPPWCTEQHLPPGTSFDEVDRWLHYSDRIKTAFPDPEEDGLGTVMVEATISAIEPVGEELEPVEVHLGDIVMSPAQLMAFASVLKTTALLASLNTTGRAEIETWQGCDYLQDPKMKPVYFMS